MNNKKILIIIIIILGITTISMGSYIIYNEINNKNNNNENTEINDNNNNKVEDTETEIEFSKIDNTKDWVHDADYNLPTNKESYYGYTDNSKLIKASDLIVPYINMNSKDAKKANQEIYKLYEELINRFNQAKDTWFTIVEYETYTNGDIVSVIITTESAGTDVALYEYYTYNFDTKDGKLLSYKDIYLSTGYTDNNINDKVEQSITNKTYSDDYDFETYNKKSIDNYKKSIQDNTIKYFIDEKNKLNVIVTIEIPAGRGLFNKIITIE